MSFWNGSQAALNREGDFSLLLMRGHPRRIDCRDNSNAGRWLRALSPESKCVSFRVDCRSRDVVATLEDYREGSHQRLSALPSIAYRFPSPHDHHYNRDQREPCGNEIPRPEAFTGGSSKADEFQHRSGGAAVTAVGSLDKKGREEGVNDDAIETAVATVVSNYRGFATLLSEEERALPLLRTALKKAKAPEHKLIYANIIGMLGDSSGAGVLADAILSQEWDEGWNFRGMGQFGGSISRLDSHIIALGKSGDAKTALPVILAKVKQLDADKEFSHHRAVSIAFESLRDPGAAEGLAEVLKKEHMSGHWITEISESDRQDERTEPLREIILVRALYRCGDSEGLGEKILKEYAKDLRALFGQHAHAILEE